MVSTFDKSWLSMWFFKKNLNVGEKTDDDEDEA